MGEKIKPQFKVGFDLPAEGIYLLTVEEVSIEPSQESEKLFKVRSVIEGSVEHGSEEDGKMVWDNFPLVSKKHFGLRRLLGFLVKLGALKEQEDYDTDIFFSPKFEEKFILIPGRKFGAHIVHRKTDKARSTEGVMANINEYYSEKEVLELIKAGPKKAPTPSQASSPTATGKEEEWI